VESDTDETPRGAARRETLEEIGLDVELGRLLAVDWVHGKARPPIVAYVYDGGVLDDDRLTSIQLQEEELLSWRLVPREELPAHLPGALATAHWPRWTSCWRAGGRRNWRTASGGVSDRRAVGCGARRGRRRTPRTGRSRVRESGVPVRVLTQNVDGLQQRAGFRSAKSSNSTAPQGR